MSWTLFKATLKANWIMALVFTLIILIYVTTSVSMFDPESASSMQAMLDMLPEGMIRAMGFVNLGTDLTVYMANYLYGFIMLVFPMIYGALMANRLIARHVDSGSMAYLLTTPNTRVRIATTQALYLIVSLATIIAVSVTVAISIAHVLFPGTLDVSAYLALNWVTYLALLAGSAVGFLGSCLFNETRHSLALGAGIPALFLVFKMVSAIGEDVSWFRFLSVYSFVDVDRVLSESGYVGMVTAVLVPLSVGLFVVAIGIFHRRSLTL